MSPLAPIAALFVGERGPYSGLAGVECWDRPADAQVAMPWGLRDARLYAGPHPVVAHPPCSRWCRLAGLVEKRWGYKRGEDEGCFEAALASVRKWSGVLEHPAYSDAWAAFGLPRPPRKGGWVRGECGGHACHVEQGRYGHPARKATWLYAVGTELPELLWGPMEKASALVGWCANHVPASEQRPRVTKAEASRTPDAFRDVLIEIARSVNVLRGIDSEEQRITMKA